MKVTFTMALALARQRLEAGDSLSPSQLGVVLAELDRASEMRSAIEDIRHAVQGSCMDDVREHVLYILARSVRP